jgi:hypothetical protein
VDGTDFVLAPECDPEQPAFWAARVDAALGVLPLSAFAIGCAGATRLISCGGEGPCYRVLSCGWIRGGAWVESVRGFAPLRGPDRVESRWQTRLGTGLLPQRLRNWRRAHESVLAAPACEGPPGFHGPYFYHSMFSEGQVLVVRWAWPVPEVHRRQWELVGDYCWLRQAGWLRSWFPGPLRPTGANAAPVRR